MQGKTMREYVRTRLFHLEEEKSPKSATRSIALPPVGDEEEAMEFLVEELRRRMAAEPEDFVEMTLEEWSKLETELGNIAAGKVGC